MRGRRGTALLVLTILTCGVAAAPSPTPPPTIARVVSRRLCSALRDQAGPVIAGLALNDRLTQQAVPVLNRFYSDRYLVKSARAVFDVTAMRDVVGRMVHNLQVVDAVLATLPTPAPSASPSADDVKVAALRKQFNDVEDAQRASINVVSGLAETDAFAELQARGNGLNGADGPSGMPATSAPDGHAGLSTTPSQSDEERLLSSGMSLGANSTSPYIAALVATDRVVVQREALVARALVAAAKECGAQPSASPLP